MVDPIPFPDRITMVRLSKALSAGADGNDVVIAMHNPVTGDITIRTTSMHLDRMVWILEQVKILALVGDIDIHSDDEEDGEE